jgi:hypothetical protein
MGRSLIFAASSAGPSAAAASPPMGSCRSFATATMAGMAARMKAWSASLTLSRPAARLLRAAIAACTSGSETAAPEARTACTQEMVGSNIFSCASEKMRTWDSRRESVACAMADEASGWLFTLKGR